MKKPSSPMTSKERLLSAIRSEPVDYVPMVHHFWSRPKHSSATWQDERERLEFYARRGWDTYVTVWCSVLPAADVVGKVRFEEAEDGPILCQTWQTPAGAINERLRVTDDWPEAQTATECIGLLHDFRTARYVEVPFKTVDDLAALPYLFPLESPQGDAGPARSLAEARALADEFQVPLFVDIRPGLDWLVWLFPAEEAVLRTIDSPEMVSQILDHIGTAYRQRLDVLLELGVDGVIRSGWYESADLWSPEIFRTYALPRLQEESRAVHDAGVPFIYLMDSGIEPLLPELNSLDFDCLAGIDPATAGGTDLAAIRSRLPGKSTWGGISGPLHLGRGTAADVENAVDRAFDACGEEGFILGPMVGFRHDWPWENLEACDRAWRRQRGTRS